MKMKWADEMNGTWFELTRSEYRPKTVERKILDKNTFDSRPSIMYKIETRNTPNRVYLPVSQKNPKSLLITFDINHILSLPQIVKPPIA